MRSGENLSEDRASEETCLQKNRYFMPEYFKWLRAKLPYLPFWSGICLGDQSRHSSNYTKNKTADGPRTFLGRNTTNAYAEQFFSMEMKNKGGLKLPIVQFVRK